ncbi:EAL domain-containing protein [Planosporangium flavigriseum]|uniref:Diguanylate cyclase (GGDEF) domain-containing protein n=1 Tax=Planosporangium flavigriseum TaxID=373681 RepID=A0A8J3LQH4_9ACTN|nr:EAL domain-containing protein [Planosporangium flavigriseum]NJC67589.1 EAL domain-containing protein [Planosporangium flavigriseum]GIG75659.1 hypothetical protein Pfl04_40630 [Planosporangium flavigriseum]
MAAGGEIRRTSAAAFLPAVIVLTVAATGWFVLNQHGPRGPLVLGWIAAPATLTLAALAQRRSAMSPGLPVVARRLWHRLATATAIAATGTVVEAAYAIAGTRSDATTVPLPAGMCFVAAMLYALWALLRVPVVTRTRGEWVRVSLDCATVVLGAAVFMWYVGFGPLLAGVGRSDAWALLAVGAGCLVAVAAVCRIVFVEEAPVDAGALRLFGFGVLIGGASAGAVTLFGGQPYLVSGQIAVPYIAVLLVLAADRQQRAETVDRPACQPWCLAKVSPLPYAAVVATDVLLVVAVAGHVDDRLYVVVGGAITITALVVVRQLVASSENARLVDRLRHQEERLRHQASHDALTRLANRAYFGECVEAALAGAGSDGGPTVLLIDLDDFKTVNDTLGHSVGDRLLAVVADRVRRCARPEDTVARLGGDEFAVLLRKAWPATVDAIAESILASLRSPVVVDGYELLVQASIGVTGAAPGDDPQALLRKADIAMYAAKEGGKDGFARYVPGMGAGILEHAKLGAQLRQALDDGQLRLLYQPVVRLADGRIIGMEALVRWWHPTRGAVSPGDFIPTAERTGLIVPLGRWVLREACRQKAVWRQAYGDLSPATIGVNVSGRQLQEPGFADEVADAVHEAGLEPHNLVLEVTETAVLTGAQALETLHALRDFGVSLALDDFGTGQSSLGLIRTCPVHILKLDKSFVMDSGPDRSQGRSRWAERQTAVASAVLHMANDLGLDAVAEGIETQEQADRMCALGYRLGQGYHLVRPLPADDIGLLLARDAAALEQL